MSDFLSGLVDTVLGAGPTPGALASNYSARQKNLVNRGVGQINAVYGGGQYPIFSPASGGFNKANPYFTYNPSTANYARYAQTSTPGNRLSGAAHGAGVGSLIPGVGTVLGAALGGLFGHGGSRGPTERQLYNRGKLYTMGQQTEPGFGKQFFSDYMNAYQQNAQSQLAPQYQQAQQQLLYKLGNQGLSNSSVATKGQQDLNLAQGTAQQGIYDQSQTAAQGLAQNIAGQKQQALQYLYQTADPAGALRQATTSAATVQRSSPLATAISGFGNFASLYGLGGSGGGSGPSQAPMGQPLYNYSGGGGYGGVNGLYPGMLASYPGAYGGAYY